MWIQGWSIWQKQHPSYEKKKPLRWLSTILMYVLGLNGEAISIDWCL